MEIKPYSDDFNLNMRSNTPLDGTISELPSIKNAEKFSALLNTFESNGNSLKQAPITNIARSPTTPTKDKELKKSSSGKKLLSKTNSNFESVLNHSGKRDNTNKSDAVNVIFWVYFFFGL